MKKILFSLVVLSILMTSLYLSEKSAHQDTQKRLAKLESDALVAKNSVKELTAKKLKANIPYSELSTFPQHFIKSKTELKKKGSKKKSEKPFKIASEFRAEAILQEISKTTSISESERTELRKLLSKHARGPKQRELLEEILGKQRSDEYYSNLEVTRAKHQTREAEKELYRLSSILSLSPEQEEQTLAVILKVNEDYRALVKETIPFENMHNPDKSNPAEILQIMSDLREAKRGLMREQLGDVLTEEQYNQLLVDQDSSPDRSFALY